MKILPQGVFDLFEKAEGFHFREDDDISGRIEHIAAEMGKARKELNSLREKAKA